MDIEATQTWKVQEALGQKLAVSGDGNQVGLQSAQLLNEFLVAGAFRLQNREVGAPRKLLDRRGLQFEIASFGAVRLRYNGQELDQRGVDEGTEAGAGQFRGPHEDSSQPSHGLNESKIQNPKSETNPKIKIQYSPRVEGLSLLNISHWDFSRISSFEFRI
jgi:hypothetical protein